MEDKIYSLFEQAITNVQSVNDKEKSSNAVLNKPAKVIGYDGDTYKATVYFQDDVNHTPYTIYNKSGEVLSDGDMVRVYYTTNPAKGWIGMRSGEPDRISSGSGCEPITGISIYSNTHYEINTNSGVEKYIAVFEDE